ncbi:MAG: hypothetical protein AB7E37_05070 [Candidatus Altimarinota bacterium]
MIKSIFQIITSVIGSLAVIFIVISTIGYYTFDYFIQIGSYSVKYKNLSKKELLKKEQELEHNLENFKKNLDNYIIIKDYLVKNNNINYISKEGIHDDFVITKDGLKNKITCGNNNSEILCKINGRENIGEFFNNLELNGVRKYYLRKDTNIGESIQYESEKGYIISFTNNVLKLERRLYDSYLYYEKGWKSFYNESNITENNIIKLPNQIITIYDDNWVISNYIDKYNFD